MWDISHHYILSFSFSSHVLDCAGVLDVFHCEFVVRPVSQSQFGRKLSWKSSEPHILLLAAKLLSKAVKGQLNHLQVYLWCFNVLEIREYCSTSFLYNGPVWLIMMFSLIVMYNAQVLIVTKEITSFS
jgi:hypothetical protein